MVSKSDQIRALREKQYERAQISKEVNNVINEAVINTSAQRQAKWRRANEDLNRSRAKEGMRKLRAQRDNASA